MLLVQENLVKLGGVILSGQMKSIDISETATIEAIEDDKGKKKSYQPTGYEAAKISIEFILEDSKDMTQEEQIAAMQRLFKSSRQTKAKLLKITNEDCAARGISKVYFQKLGTKNVVSESGRTAVLELIAPVTAGIKTKKKSAGLTAKNTVMTAKLASAKTIKNKGKSPVKKKFSTLKEKNKIKAMIR